VKGVLMFITLLKVEYAFVIQLSGLKSLLELGLEIKYVKYHVVVEVSKLEKSEFITSSLESTLVGIESDKNICRNKYTKLNNRCYG